ncbi:SAV_915 family protein [Streptomyces murinus]|uniref:SseB protein N-terminal domain-containing protein n=2 Tax=Actinomycetes TaxID=1760 RepID=A0ABP5Y0Q4_9ACTN|nr:SAV_915 family protein [Streptomyces sp. S816]
MTAPIRSRLLDFVEAEPGPPGGELPEEGARPRRSALSDLAESAPAPRAASDGRPAPRPGVPAYHTPVFVPAHPRSVAATGSDGRPARVPFVVFELFEHPAHGMAALAFTTPEKLVEALGEAQPWAATSLGPLAEGVADRDVTVLLDPRLAPGEPNWRPEDLAAYAQEVRR